MPNAVIRFNPDHSQCEITTPDDVEYGPEAVPEDLLILTSGDDGRAYIAAFGVDGLDPNTVYELTPVDTEVEEGELGEDDDEEEPETPAAT